MPHTAPHIVVIGGGIAGLAAVERLAREAADFRITLLEARDRLGGMIVTERAGGFVMEGGPDVVLAAKPEAIELCRRLGIAERLHGTNPGVRGSYILSRGRLVRLPAGVTGLVPARLGPVVLSSLISPLGKLRGALDFVIPARRDGVDESVQSFVVRRLGREIYDRLVEPLLSGIFAGDGSRLSIGATFPHLRAYEEAYGGLLRGMRAARREMVTPRGGLRPGATATRTPHAPGFLSLPRGLAEIVEAIEATLSGPRHGLPTVAIRRNRPVARVELPDREVGPVPAEWITITTEDGEVVRADAVVVATPAHVAARLLVHADAQLAATLREIDHVATATVSLTYPRAAVPHALDATGYTVPRLERRPVLACTWSSAKFTNRAPDRHALFRVYLGGAGREEYVGRSDADLVRLAQEELRQVLRITAHPGLVRVVRWECGIPQYHLGHLQRVARIDQRLTAVPGIALAGNAYGGIGIPDCIRSGERAAARVLAHVVARRPAASAAR